MFQDANASVERNKTSTRCNSIYGDFFILNTIILLSCNMLSSYMFILREINVDISSEIKYISKCIRP
jgi:hypothetical protein